MEEGLEGSRKPWATPEALKDVETRVKALENEDPQVQIPGDLDARLVEYTSNATADTRDPVAHGLKRIPVGYIVVSKSSAGDVYQDKGAPWTADRMFLKCSGVSVSLKLLVF